ncbi:hypothetical protein [Burkholderia singularis]|uniref:hypothetical protein n=2 Tax=Burkholderia TaxID=32008 RepID=UPI000AD14408|nr:hypothetical protein [Burkholderia sp. Bp7605]
MRRQLMPLARPRQLMNAGRFATACSALALAVMVAATASMAAYAANNIQIGTVASFSGKSPAQIAIKPDGATAYVANAWSDNVSAIRVRGSTTLGKANTAPASGAMLLMPFGR